ncbi:MAG: response regulator [Clostridiales bacterium]|nr:response regulator [Clostridiales bacterium]
MRKVMIVEDEELILQGIKSIVPWDALDLMLTHMAHNGREALSLWEKEPVDIIITDIEMPEMNGLELLHSLREKSDLVRFLILTGYEEFEYAREAIRLGVEDYILKPIDEDALARQLRAAVVRLEELEKERFSYIDEKTEWIQFLSGKMGGEEYEYYRERLILPEGGGPFWVGLMKWSNDNAKEKRITDMILALQNEDPRLRAVHLPPDCLLLLLSGIESPKAAKEYLQRLQTQIESRFDILTFVSIGPSFDDYRKLPDSYRVAVRLQKYLLVEGYGSCVEESYIQARKSEDITIDRTLLRKLILKRESEGAVGYIEDLFINNVKTGVSIDSLYQMTVQIAMLLQEIKREYKLENVGALHDLTELLETIYEADDIFGIKALFISEVNDIIQYLHEADSQYTPVVRWIMAEVQKNYKEDMNLKTLAYKYYMNASYLGQIFQKEVGCSFAQYLNSKKMEVAKELILNTNMKISDIAKEVGYPDTSYFYRKFKQYYGVAPASLREMKKY